MLATLIALGACSSTAPRGAHSGALTAARPTLDRRDSALVARIDSFTQARAAMDSLSGVVLLARDGVPIYTSAIGLANRATGAPNRLDTRFNLASLDKYFTRIAIRQLQQAGKLSVTDLVGKHLPEYPNRRVREEVTIKHLLDMRSGLGDFDGDNYATLVARRLTLRTLDDYLALFANDSLDFDPGSKQAYSNAGYVVLGKVIERASGQSYYDYVRQHVFEPAGMVNTGYYAPDDRAPNTAIPYTTAPAVIGDFGAGAKKLSERRPATSLLAYRGSSAGGGYSTAEDLLRLSIALHARRLLNAAFTDSLLNFRPGPFSFDGWAGGSEGINTVFYMHTTGHTLIVLSNYDPPSANDYRRNLWSDWLPAWLRTSTP
jgi:CubicO group peptidase (beta-lactamase class C family)